MVATFRKILELLTPQERRRGLLVLGMVLVMALVETAGVASVMPFLAVLGNPEMAMQQDYLARAYDWLGFDSVDSFLVALGIGSFLIVIGGALIRVGTLWALYRYVNMRRHSVSQRLLTGYLRQPYEFFLNRNTADLSKSILSEVDELTRNVFQPGIKLLAYATSALLLVGFLIIMDPMTALVVTLVVGGSYVLLYLGIRGVLGRVGRARVAANRERFTAASEVLGGIKDIRVLGREATYLERFRKPSAEFSRHQSTNSVLSLVPKYMIEGIGFGGILALTVYLMATQGDLGAALPIVGVYAFAGYRLLPAAQHIFGSLANLRFGLGAVEVVHRDLMSLPGGDTPLLDRPDRDVDRVQITRALELSAVSYHYPGADIPALREISVRIPRGASLGIVGPTGAGKTTLVDVLLGLLAPSGGQVLVDGRSIHEVGVRAWQRSIGYVPQHIFLTDASIAENIALGVPGAAIDMAAVEAAARAAQIHEFVASLHNGYQTPVGERGVRLSGGERQRIGIARALYNNPALLVLDEATSALDSRTESLAMTAITELRGEKTMVIIAHRLATVQACDAILVLEGGAVAGLGTYDELERTNDAFQRVAAG